MRKEKKDSKSDDESYVCGTVIRALRLCKVHLSNLFFPPADGNNVSEETVFSFFHFRAFPISLHFAFIIFTCAVVADNIFNNATGAADFYRQKRSVSSVMFLRQE